MRKIETLVQAHRLKLAIAVLSFTLLSGTAAWGQGSGNAFRFKDVEIGFTTQFKWLYDDGGTGARRSGSVWRPIPRAGFYSIGDVFRPDHGNPNGKMVAFTVKPLSNTAVAVPTGYDVIWTDGGSGGRHDGAIYVPRCPSGYHYLGHAGGNYQPPSRAQVCLRQDLVARGGIGGTSIWDDAGSGARLSVSIWPVVPVRPPKNVAYLTAGTFLGASHHGKPTGYGMAWTLQVEVKEQEPSGQQLAVTPRLTGYSKPAPEFGHPRVTRTTFPWFAVNDPGFSSSAEQMLLSPVYTLERTDRYELLCHYNNTTSALGKCLPSQEVGFSESKTREFNSTTTVGMEATAGSEALGLSVTVKLEHSFSFGSSSTRENSMTSTRAFEQEVSPGKAVAMWGIKSSYRMLRADGREVNRIEGIDTMSIVADEFPDAATAQTGAGNQAGAGYQAAAAGNQAGAAITYTQLLFNEDQQNTYWAGSDDVLYMISPQQQTTQIGTATPSTDARFALMLHLNNGAVFGVDGTQLLIWSADQNGQLIAVGRVVKGQ